MFEKEAYNRLVRNGVKPSVQRMAIMQYLLDHRTHPTVEDVYKDLYQKIPTLSRTTVYNTLRLLSENNAAQMITIDEHRVCYDGETEPHVHFYCKKCKSIMDLESQDMAEFKAETCGHRVDSVQVYYKGVCSECLKKEDND